MVAHAGYIIAAYAVTGVVLGGMLLAVLLDHRAQAARLVTLSERLGRRPHGAVVEGDDDEP